jgi:hypothetical protein
MSPGVDPQVANFNPTAFGLENQQRQANLATTQQEQQLRQQDIGLRQQQVQEAQVKNQLAQRQLQDMQAIQNAYAQYDKSSPTADEDLDKNIMRNTSYAGYAGWKTQNLAWNKAYTEIDKDRIPVTEHHNSQINDVLQTYRDAITKNPAVTIQHWAQITAPALQQLGVNVDPTNPWVGAQLDGQIGLVEHHANTLANLKTVAETTEATQKGQQAAAEATKAEAELPGITAKGEIEQRQAAAMKDLNPQTLKSWVDAAVPPTGTTAALNARTQALASTAIASGEPLDKVTALIKDASDQIGRTETALRTEQAKAPTELAIAAENRRQQQLFQSYTQNNGEIDKLAVPVQQTERSIGDIRTLMAEGSPQAWANIPAKLLSLTVGGPGSGLRMNNAQLDRELGGAGKWVALQGRLQQWSLDPASASRIPDVQRKEIESIVNALDARVQEKLGVINKSRESLIGAPDVETHRRTVLKTNQDLQTIDNKAGQTKAKTYTQVDIDDAAKQYGLSKAQIEQTFQRKGWKRQ